MVDREPTIYVAGPMRGHADFNHPAFDRQSEVLCEQGWVVINPADMDRNIPGPATDLADPEFLRDALRRDIIEICNKCTAIYMMSGWESSKGAKAEWAIAKALGLDIYYEAPLPRARGENSECD